MFFPNKKCNRHALTFLEGVMVCGGGITLISGCCCNSLSTREEPMSHLVTWASFLEQTCTNPLDICARPFDAQRWSVKGFLFYCLFRWHFLLELQYTGRKILFLYTIDIWITRKTFHPVVDEWGGSFLLFKKFFSNC